MKNKRLEERLRKRDVNCEDVIKMIESCESGTIFEIRFGKGEKITGSPVLDRMVITYLKDLKVKVEYNKTTSVAVKKPKKKAKKAEKKSVTCKNEIHKVLGGKMKKSPTVKIMKKKGWKMFKIDETTFVSCPNCYEIQEIK